MHASGEHIAYDIHFLVWNDLNLAAAIEILPVRPSDASSKQQRKGASSENDIYRYLVDTRLLFYYSWFFLSFCNHLCHFIDIQDF